MNRLKPYILMITLSLSTTFVHASYNIYLMNNTQESVNVSNVCDDSISSPVCNENSISSLSPLQRIQTFTLNYDQGLKNGKEYTLKSYFKIANSPVDNYFSIKVRGYFIGTEIRSIDAHINGHDYNLLNSNNSYGKVVPNIMGNYTFTDGKKEYTVYATAQHDHSTTQGIDSIYFTIHEKPETLDSVPNKNVISVMSYNIQAFPNYMGVALDLNKMDTRIKYLATMANVNNYDVVVFQEAWDSGARDILKHSLRNSYPYVMDPTPDNIHGLVFNSGLLAFSKYPITKEKFVNYQDYQSLVDADKLTNKGALYFQLDKNGKIYNMITTHAQAQDYAEAIKVRQEEFNIINEHIVDDPALNINKNEPLLLVGDINTDLYNPEQMEYMRETLNLDLSGMQNTLSEAPKYSYDSTLNLMIDPSVSEKGLYDYAIPFNNYQKPIKSEFQITPVRAVDFADMYQASANMKLYNYGDIEISDHFMVQGRFTFE